MTQHFETFKLRSITFKIRVYIKSIKRQFKIDTLFLKTIQELLAAKTKENLLPKAYHQFIGDSVPVYKL